MAELSQPLAVQTFETLPDSCNMDEYQLALNGLCSRVGEWLDRPEAADPSLGGSQLGVVQFQRYATGDTAHFYHSPVIMLQRTPHNADGGDVYHYGMYYDGSTAHPQYFQDEQARSSQVRYDWAVAADSSLRRPLVRTTNVLDTRSLRDWTETGEVNQPEMDIPMASEVDQMFRLDNLLARVASQSAIDTIGILALRAREAIRTPLSTRILGPIEVFPTADGIGFSRHFLR